MQSERKKVFIERIEPLNGASGGLSQKTARIKIRLEGDWHHWTDQVPNVMGRLPLLLPQECGKSGTQESAPNLELWSASYLEAPVTGGPFARMTAALTVAIQREARVPAWRARVADESPHYIHLALPYENAEWLKAALLWALRLLAIETADDASAEVSRQSQLVAPFHAWLSKVQSNGLTAELFGYAMAAHTLLLPVRLDDNDVVIGWGSRQARLQPHSRAAHGAPDPLPLSQASRIPVAAITGTNGKTTTARMLHHIICMSGVRCGVNTSQGIWVGRDQITQRNLSGQPGGRILLNDPRVEAAVLEMPRKGLISFGHPCDRYDVAALLNVEDDHIGTDGIESLDEMARLKAEVLERANDAVIVNADDRRCLAMLAHAGTSRHILVAGSEDNPRVLEHRERGGEAVFIGGSDEERSILLARGARLMRLVRLREIPATMNGLLRFNESNALFAAALAWAQQIDIDIIRRALASFHNVPEQNAGRFNFVDSLPFKVLIDYAHNPAGMRGLVEVAARIDVRGRRVLVNSNGLRFQHHLAQELPLYPTVFDRIYIGPYEDYFLRAARGFDPADPIGDMLAQARAQLTPLLRPGQALHTLRHHVDALRAGLEACEPGDLLVMLCEPEDAEAAIRDYRSRRQASSALA